MPLADYNLPATSAWADGPDSASAIQELQLEGVRLMVNERIEAHNQISEPIGFEAIIPPFTFPIFRSAAACIGVMQTKLSNILFATTNVGPMAVWIDEEAHPGGIITNAETVSFYSTVSQILTAAGVGVGGAFTREPARNIWGRAATGGDPVANDLCYKEHINEIITVCQKMKFLSVVVGMDGGGGSPYTLTRFGRQLRYTRAEAVAAASDEWDAGSWLFDTDQKVDQYSQSLDNDDGTFFASIVSHSNVFLRDLSPLTTFPWTLTPYICVGKSDFNVQPTTWTGYGNPPVAASVPIKWQPWTTETPAAGAAWVSNPLAFSKPSFCPEGPETVLVGEGWKVSGRPGPLVQATGCVIIATPTFTLV